MIAALRLIATAVVGLVICISLVACGEEKQQQEGAMNTASAKIEGSVSYRERMALPLMQR